MFTFSVSKAFKPDLELTDDGIYTISLTGKTYDPEAPVSLKKGDVLLHSLTSRRSGGVLRVFFPRTWNLVVRTPDGDLARNMNTAEEARNGGEALRGDVMRDLRVGHQRRYRAAKNAWRNTGAMFSYCKREIFTMIDGVWRTWTATERSPFGTSPPFSPVWRKRTTDWIVSKMRAYACSNLAVRSEQAF